MLISILAEIGFDQCIADEGCFVLSKKEENMDGRKDCIIRTHVDDMLAIGLPAALDKAETGIEDTVELDKRGKPESMLGMELI